MVFVSTSARRSLILGAAGAEAALKLPLALLLLELFLEAEQVRVDDAVRPHDHHVVLVLKIHRRNRRRVGVVNGADLVAVGGADGQKEHLEDTVNFRIHLSRRTQRAKPKARLRGDGLIS